LGHKLDRSGLKPETMTRDELERILAEFPNISVLVVGDFCLDRWCTYDPELASASRETGIPRTAVVACEVTPGAGGTVTNNLKELGAGRIGIVAVVGDDGNGFELERALRCRGIGTQYLLRAPGRHTFTYTKLLNARTGEEDLPRLDFVNTAPPGAEVEQKIVEALDASIPAADVVLVADQSEIAGGAVITDRVREALIAAAERFPEKVFVADSRAQVEKFRGLIVKPNEDEAREAVRRICCAGDDSGESPRPLAPENPTVEEVGEVLRQHLGGKLPLYITRGPEGALLFSGPPAAGVESPRQPGPGPQLIPARRNLNPVDICGAGDAFEAGLALALAATQRLYGKRDYAAAAQVGHLVAAVTITKKGTGTASPAEVLSLLQGPRVSGSKGPKV